MIIYEVCLSYAHIGYYKTRELAEKYRKKYVEDNYPSKNMQRIRILNDIRIVEHTVKED